MRPYFEKMKDFGQELKAGQIKSTEANVGKLKEVEAQVDEALQKVKDAGLPTEKINALYSLCDNPQQFLPQACTTLRDCLQPRTLQTTEAFVAEVDQRLLMMAKGFFNISS